MPPSRWNPTKLLLSLSTAFLLAAAGFAFPAETAFLISPRSVTPGDTIRVLAATESMQTSARLTTVGPTGRLSSRDEQRGGGPPFWWSASFPAGSAGEYRIELVSYEKSLGSATLVVTPEKTFRPPAESFWEAEAQWDRERENLFSAWLEALFLEAEEGDTWNPLHALTRDPSRNLLHNHLGWEEDSAAFPRGLIMEPDCADNPFVLRAYFAWKTGLPYGHHRCDRGRDDRAPECTEWESNQARRRPGHSHLQAFQTFVRRIMNTIHAGSARTALDAEKSDLYPLPLERRHLRPGTVYADPYGHTLTMIRWIDQTPEEPGMLLAVDAQPDGTIGIKRFWRGNFLFAVADIIGEPGFKGFRPVVLNNGKLIPLRNAEIGQNRAYGNFSLQQRNLDPDTFYDSMDRLINPEPLDPYIAFREIHTAVHEYLLARVVSVANGESFMQTNAYAVVPMPAGRSIFQTSGPWEDYSTPSRDMRLLISLDILLDFPRKVVRSPEAFHLPEGKTPDTLRKELEALHARWAQELTLRYIRSDRSAQVLTLADVIQRREALEMAYNPNDCVEIRWGAPEGSEERRTCSRRAPPEQLERMKAYRRWFRARVIPIR